MEQDQNPYYLLFHILNGELIEKAGIAPEEYNEVIDGDVVRKVLKFKNGRAKKISLEPDDYPMISLNEEALLDEEKKRDGIFEIKKLTKDQFLKIWEQAEF